MKIKFGDLPSYGKFQHGKSIYLKCRDPLTGTCMGGVRFTGKCYHWKAFDDNKLVERIENNV